MASLYTKFLDFIGIEESDEQEDDRRDDGYYRDDAPERAAGGAFGAGCRQNLRRAGELLSAGNTGAAAGRAGNGRDYCLLQSAEGAGFAGKRTCGQQLTNDTYYCGLR